MTALSKEQNAELAKLWREGMEANSPYIELMVWNAAYAMGYEDGMKAAGMEPDNE